jgi:hypothetical protein
VSVEHHAFEAGLGMDECLGTPRWAYGSPPEVGPSLAYRDQRTEAVTEIPLCFYSFHFMFRVVSRACPSCMRLLPVSSASSSSSSAAAAAAAAPSL